MPNFFYKAKDGPAKIVEGTINAESRAAVVAKLAEQGFFPISVEESEKDKAPAVLKKQKVSPRDTGVFTRQLADLLEGGLTLFQSMDTLVSQTENKTFSGIIAHLRDMIREGNPLSTALESYPKVFSKLYVNMVRSGETGGVLDKVLLRLADFSDKEQELRSRVRGAMMYPLFLGSFGVLTVFGLVIFVVPRLASVFRDLGQTLPLPTRLLMGTSDFIVKWWWLVAVIIVIGVLIIRQQGKTAEGRYIFDRWKLKVPIIGKLIISGELSGFSRTLATLLESGVPVIRSLDVVVGTLKNEVIRRELAKVQTAISKGASLGNSMHDSKYFPPLVTNMIKIGEKGGMIERSLMKVADTYDGEIDRSTRMFTTLLEPIMILTLGLVVGFIVICMLLPIFNLNLSVR